MDSDIDDEILALAGDSPVKSRTRSRRYPHLFNNYFFHYFIIFSNEIIYIIIKSVNYRNIKIKNKY